MKFAILFSLSLFTASQFNLVAAQREIYVALCKNEEWGDCSTGIYTPDVCSNLGKGLDDKITGYKIFGRCCAFYRHPGCNKEDFLFARASQHSRLPPYDNDIICSFKCKLDCMGEYLLNPHGGKLDGWPMYKDLP